MSLICPINGDSREVFANDEWVQWFKDFGPINAIITDPPYGVDFQSGFAATDKGKQYAKKIEGDGDPIEAMTLFRDVMKLLMPHLADQAEIYIFTQWQVMEYFRMAINIEGEPFGVQVKNLLVWEKGWPGLGDLEADWPKSFELIWYAKKGRRPIPSRECSVIAIDRVPSGKMVHPTEKPVALIQRLLDMSTNEGDLVVDPFAGSFSTADACNRSGRQCIAVEKDVDHFERGRRRLAVGDLFSS